jgi:hypothetical protein
MSALGWVLLVAGCIAAAMIAGELVDWLKRRDHAAHAIRHAATHGGPGLLLPKHPQHFGPPAWRVTPGMWIDGDLRLRINGAGTHHRHAR